MKILAVSDAVAGTLYDHFDAEHWRKVGVELILGCGDLPADYLSFLVTAFKVPMWYVRGNHDSTYDEHPPQGCQDIDGRLVRFGRLRILGMGGSAWYNGGPMQYTESQMAWRIRRRLPAIWLAGGVDLVVAHAPPQFCPYPNSRHCSQVAGVGQTCAGPLGGETQQVCQDASDRAHRGFASFRGLILRHHPAYFLHGHRHQSFGRGKREVVIGQTRVIDTYGHRVVDVQSGL